MRQVRLGGGSSMRACGVVAVAAALGLGAACGAPQKPGAGEGEAAAAAAAGRPAGLAPAPVPKSATGVQRTLSADSKADYLRAVARYRELGTQGWNGARCREAADLFDGVADSHPKLVEARFDVGVAWANCGDWDRAEKAYQETLRVSATYAPALANLGEIAHRRGNVSLALNYYEKAIAADQKIVSARTNLAQILRDRIKAGERTAAEDALGHLRRALAVDSDSMVAYTTLALLFYDIASDDPSKLDLAGLVCEQARRVNDKHAPIYNVLGLIWLKKRNVTAALAQFKRAVALDPGLNEAQMNIGSITLSFRDYLTAEQAFRSVLTRDPKSCDAMVGLGVALRGQRKIDEAEQQYGKAGSCGASDPRIQAAVAYDLGVLYQDYRSGAPAELRKAIGFYDDFIQRARGGDRVEDARRRIANINDIFAAQEEAKKMEAEMQRMQQLERQQQQAPAPAPKKK